MALMLRGALAATEQVRGKEGTLELFLVSTWQLSFVLNHLGIL
jgi:hypothetical protein